jgi:transposase-like protein
MGSRRRFTPEFKLEAVKLVKECGVTIRRAATDLGLHQNVLRKWVKNVEVHREQAFPGYRRFIAQKKREFEDEVDAELGASSNTPR